MPEIVVINDDDEELLDDDIEAEYVGSDYEIGDPLMGPTCVSVGDRFQCTTCQKSFSNKANCLRHFALHLGKTKCPVCGRVYSRESVLKKHAQMKHDILIWTYTA